MFANKIIFIQLFLFIFHIIEAIYEKELSTIKLYYSTENEELQISENLANLMSIKPSLPLPILIHGWNADKDHMAMEPVRDAYLKTNRSVFIVDWQELAYLPYGVTRPLVTRIGERIGSILRPVLESLNISPQDVHLVGHSLGAHISGIIGRKFNGEIGRITCLDSAGPLFGKLSLDALSPNDAIFVQCIHTAAGTLGEKLRRADIDIYPNGGTSPQPGCVMLDIITLGSCSHYRAPLYFAESILLPQSFPSFECQFHEILGPTKSCTNFEDASDSVVFMGEAIESSSRGGTYYLETNSNFPYGKGIQ